MKEVYSSCLSVLTCQLEAFEIRSSSKQLCALYLVVCGDEADMTSPHTYAEMKSRGRTDTELMMILEAVHLEYLPGREGGWETRKEWKDVLS